MQEHGRDCVASSDATFHRARSANRMRDIRPTNGKDRIGGNHMIDIVRNGTLTVVSSGSLTVKPLDVTYVADLSCNMFSLMAACRRRVGFTIVESGLFISLFDSKLRVEGDGSKVYGFGCRIEPDDHWCAPPPNVPPYVTPNLPVNHVDDDRGFHQTSPVIAPDGDGSNESEGDNGREFSIGVPAVDPSPGVESLRPGSEGRASGGEFGKFCAQVCTTEGGVTGRASGFCYARDSSPRHAQADKVVETDDDAPCRSDADRSGAT